MTGAGSGLWRRMAVNSSHPCAPLHRQMEGGRGEAVEGEFCESFTIWENWDFILLGTNSVKFTNLCWSTWGNEKGIDLQKHNAATLDKKNRSVSHYNVKGLLNKTFSSWNKLFSLYYREQNSENKKL